MSTRNQLSSRPLRRIGSMILVPALALAIGACTTAASPTNGATLIAPAVPPSVVSTGLESPGRVALPVPVGGTTVGGMTLGGSDASGVGLGAPGAGVSVPGAAIALPYPYYGGTPGVAPDHSILVTGTGQASLKTDGSDAATAERNALTKAIAQARARADEVATAAGVSITGVLSVSVSVGQNWVAPVGIETPDGTTTPPTTGSAPEPAQPITTPVEVEVTVTVAYTIGS
jgi:hypothetical protein